MSNNQENVLFPTPRKLAQGMEFMFNVPCIS